LSLHVFFRNRKRGEDFRYAAWRRRWGRWFVPRSYLQIFVLQGAIMLVIASPLLILARASDAPWSALDAVGLSLWTGGFVFEAAADAQLARFKRRPENKGRIMAEGLWRFTRHPNYFGEAVMWWGIFLIVLSVRGSWPAVISPLLMTFLLRCVSGVPMLERKYSGDPDFAAYAAKTNAFLPWFPRS
jgi:steroid 5-alpha reductase family enzyme